MGYPNRRNKGGIEFNYLTPTEYRFLQDGLASIYRFPGHIEPMFGQIFEDLFAEMKQGEVIKTGSRSSVDVVGNTGIKFSLKTKMLRTNLPVENYFCKKIDIQFSKISREKLFIKNNYDLNIFQENINNIYNKFQEQIDRQVFLIRVLDSKMGSRGIFLYWEQPFEVIDFKGYKIFENQGGKGVDKNRFESQIRLKSSPTKFFWTSASQSLVVYYKIPEDADIIIINKDSPKMSWPEFIEKVK
jgi:hypothetical protein